MDDLRVESVPYNVIPVTEYDPFEAKFAASLYWLVFRATEDGAFENIPSQVTSPIQRDSEKRITVRPEVTEFLTNGEIYCKVCDSIFHSTVPVVGHWAILQTLSRHEFYVVEEGDLAVTDSALQQKKPFKKSTHLALMDCLMNAFSSQAVTVQQVVQSVSKFSSFNASKELPFDLEDALLLWINKICSALNDNQLQKQKQHAEQLLQNQDKAKRFRFRRDQLQPKVQTAFPVIDELLKDISDGQSLLGIVMFYHPSVIKLEDVRFGKDLSIKDSVHNLDLFRSLCSQFICTSVLALKLEDLLYGSHAMKPNIIALLSEMFEKCEAETLLSENGIHVDEEQSSKSDINLKYLGANKENLMDNRSSSDPILSSEERTVKGSLSTPGQLGNANMEAEDKYSVWKSRSESQINNSNSRLSFKSPFQLDFTAHPDSQPPPQNALTPRQDLEKERDKENPFSGIFQRPVLAGESRKRSLPNVLGGGGSPRVTPKQENPLLLRRSKQKQRTLDLEEWDMPQSEEVEELYLSDLQRSQSLTGLDKAKVEPRQSFQAWRDETGASLSDTNLAASRSEKISLDFRPITTRSVPQREMEGTQVPTKSTGLRVSSKYQEEHISQDSLGSSPKSTDSLTMRPAGNPQPERKDILLPGARDSLRSDISAKELSQFEEIEAMILAGRSVETPRKFVKSSKPSNTNNAREQEEDELDTSVSSDDMSKFRLEVLQRLTEDKLREIPDGAEMEDDDDPILRARNNAASSSPRNPPEQCARLDVKELAADVALEQLSPITEATEPCSSVAASSPNSTAPSSPCSPLDIAPFMPEFFTTSPANTLDRSKHRKSLMDRDDTDRTLVAEPSEPQVSHTPRTQTKSVGKIRDVSSKNRSFEQLARGSYTVGHLSVESAQAAGIPVIAEVTSVDVRERSDSQASASGHRNPGEVFRGRTLSDNGAHLSQDLSGFRELVLSSESGEAAVEAVDGRRDSLDNSPLPSPSLPRDQDTYARDRDAPTRDQSPRTRGQDAPTSVTPRLTAVNARDGVKAQDSPGDVVIYERSLSSASHENEQDCTAQVRGNPEVNLAQGNFETVTRPKRTDALLFDFNQHVVDQYHGDEAPDYKTYKKGKQAVVSTQRISYESTAAWRGAGEPLGRGLDNKDSNRKDLWNEAPEQRPSSHHGRVNEFAANNVSYESTVAWRGAGEPSGRGLEKDNNSKDLWNEAPEQRPSSHHGRVNEFAANNDVPDSSRRERFGEEIPESRPAVEEVRQSDGFTTYRRAATPTTTDELLAQFSETSAKPDKFSTVVKSAKTQGDQYYGGGGSHYVTTETPPRLESQPLDITARPLSSRGGDERSTSSPRGGGGEEQIRTSGSSNIVRSRTFRKKPDGQIVEGEVIRSSSTSGYDEERADSTHAGQQTIATPIRGSPEGAGSDNPHRISWSDESESGARLVRQVNADRSTSSDAHNADSPRLRGSPRHSPRQTGRGSPGARISWLTAAKSGVGGQVILNDRGEIEESPEDNVEDEQAMTSQLAYLRMQLDEKRRHIEAEKFREQEQWEDQRRRLGQTAFWYVIGKAQGGQEFGEGSGAEVTHSDQPPLPGSRSQGKLQRPEPELPGQPSPPIAWSSPASSPLPASAHRPSHAQPQLYETREFRLSEHPPFSDRNVSRPSSEPAVDVALRQTPVPARPSSHEPAASHYSTPTRKCWDVNTAVSSTPPPFVRPETAQIKSESKAVPRGGGGAFEFEVEVEQQTPSKKGLAMFIGDDTNTTTESLTPEQEKKKEKFLKLRQRKQEEERTRKEAEHEKKRRKEEKQREKEMLQKMEEERLRREELERQKTEQEWRAREATQIQAPRVPDSYGTYRAEPRKPSYDVGDDTNSYFVLGPTQPTGFSEFSGPQCYVKPSGKSNRKLIVNAVSHVCLSGTVNQEQKEKCLQAVSESDGHHFMILFKDGLKFRGLYIHNLENDQLYKIFGIGPRLITAKMVDSLYKYNSGGKEFVKIPSKTLSVSVDGLAIHKSCWQSGKPAVQSKTASNLKRPPRPPQR